MTIQQNDSRRSLFAAIAPRLERAHREERDRLAADHARWLAAVADVQRLERLVAHRELQALRATTRSAFYVRERYNRLSEAQAALSRARAREARTRRRLPRRATSHR